MDLAGLDVHLAVAQALFPKLSNEMEPPPLLVDLVEQEKLGTKSGHGLHGNYRKASIQKLTARRTDALLALAALEDP